MLRVELKALDEMSGFVRCLKQERAFGIASFREIFPGKFPLWYARNWENNYLNVMSAELKIGAAAQFSVANELAAQQARLAAAGPLTQLVYPALAAARDAMDRVRAEGRCLMVISAFLQAAKGNGEAELKLDQLKIDPRFTIDPFSGATLLTKKTAEGWIVYSIGRDGKDDGGAISEPFADVGLGPVRIQ